MLSFDALTKRYGPRTAVDALTATVTPGAVTGVLGPNGAGKSTTFRLIVGLDAPTSGRALIGGRRYVELPRPLLHVGALLDADAVDGARTARQHLAWIARSQRIATGRVAAVLTAVGLDGPVMDRRIGTFSLGMRQRLGIATALLGDPAVLLLDEPMNGLDPAGIRWVRDVLRDFAAEGRTVLVSSHLIGEMTVLADRLLVMDRGRLVADTTVRDLAATVDAGAGAPGSPDDPPRPDLIELAYLRLTGALEAPR